MITRLSPNYGPRQSDIVDMLVIHYTGMESAQAALDRLCDADAQVSAHYLIDEDGTVYAFVDESRRAWHAGVSSWRGHADINSRSIGIELVNPGHEFGLRPFPDPQIESLMSLGRDVLIRHPIPARNVIGHSDIAPARKQDPGELFPWALLAQNGLGVWPPAEPVRDRPLIEALTLWGYDITDEKAAVAAFQRHFRPSRIDGGIDRETTQIASRLITPFA